jgi:hypothetical protein
MTTGRNPSSFRSVSAAIFSLALLVGAPLATANAATLDAPDTVCVGEEFKVDWTGPNGQDDLIVIAYPDAPPDVFDNAQRADEGSPATLRAPLMPGVYEVRYVQRNPLAVLEAREIEVGNCVSEAASTHCPLPEYPIDSYAVVVTGVQSDTEMEFPQQQVFTLQQLCGASELVGAMLGDLMTRVQAPLNVPTDMIRNNVANQMRAARDAICPAQESPGSDTWFSITYAHCRMAMETLPHSMDIHLPPGLGEGTMSIADHGQREVMTMTLKRNIEAVADFATGAGWSDEIRMTPTERSGSHAGFATREYDFESTGGLGNTPRGGGDVSGLAGLVSVKSEGTAWMANCVPGINIVRAFYEKLNREMEPDGESMSFFGGMIQNSVSMLEKGMPMEVEQTTSARIMGVTQGSGTSRSVVTGFNIIRLPSQWCEASLMPAGYAVTDIDQQVSEILRDAPGGGAGGSAEAAGAMQQINEAMQQLTPEQRQMMEQLGMGGMMPQAPAANPATRSEAAPPARGAMPSPEALYSDDLTQMVQKHLDALGYDTGNTSGEMSLETTIAISQFQAERGLEVTGEVSPQLVGLLSAEVDKRR